MENFIFYNPTKIIFGRGTIGKAGGEVKKFCNKILLVYGSKFIKKSGLLDKTVKSLKEAGVEYFELSGVVPNPRLGLVNEGIKLCKNNGIDFILALGGGSVIDTAKAIGVGSCYEGDGTLGTLGRYWDG